MHVHGWYVHTLQLTHFQKPFKLLPQHRCKSPRKALKVYQNWALYTLRNFTLTYLLVNRIFLIIILGEAMSGRYVIVQMDNGVGVPLNLKEVRAFGANGETVGA